MKIYYFYMLCTKSHLIYYTRCLICRYRWVSDCCLLLTEHFIEVYHGENVLPFDEMMILSVCTRPTHSVTLRQIMLLNHISAILWWSVLLVEETGVPGKNHRPAASHWLTVSALSLIFIVPAHWCNSHHVDISIKSDMSWFHDNQSLFFIHNVACLMGK
jgi:hypothetical protein